LHGEWAAWRRCRLVIPEYRGQFASVPLVGESITVERSAADVAELASVLGIRHAIVLSWSTGVQVGLQLALDRPELVEAMVLIQGTTGQALNCLLQPPCKIPGMPSLLALVIRKIPAMLLRCGRRKALHDQLVKRQGTLERLGRCILWIFGSDLMPAGGVRYVQDMVHTDAHFSNYCGYAFALDAHRIDTRLQEIKAPTLVVTGTPDFVTPARCSYDLAASLGGKTELFDDIGGSHYYIWEEPHKLASRMARFLDLATGQASAEP